jgi:predicted phosphodiesterase
MIEGNFLNIKVPKGTTLAVISDIHEHEEQFRDAVSHISPSKDTILVSLGDIYDKGFGERCAQSITGALRDLVNSGVAYVIKGNHELKHLRRLRKEERPIGEHLSWIEKLPLSLSFVFRSGARLTIVHGGVRPKHTWDDIRDSVETSYIRQLDKSGRYIKLKKKVVDGKKIMVPAKPGGVVWHEKYDGRFGYIISGHDSQKDGISKFYNYSCNIDTACYHTGKLTVQMFGERGKGELLTFSGTPKFPDIEEMQRLMAQGLV